MLLSFVMKTAISLKGLILYNLIVHSSPLVREKEDQVIKYPISMSYISFPSLKSLHVFILDCRFTNLIRFR